MGTSSKGWKEGLERKAGRIYNLFLPVLHIYDLVVFMHQNADISCAIPQS